jgi:hypothetical protein
MKKNEPRVDISNLRTRYSNACRIMQTPNEVIVDFGTNLNFFGDVVNEPMQLENRIIMSPDAAKRLCIHLTATIQKYEERYGVIELDEVKRVKTKDEEK